MIQVLVADDHRILRQGLCALLRTQTDFDVIGEASNGIEACELVQALQPDVLVVDMRMPGKSGVEVIRHTRECSPLTSIVVLSMYATGIYVSQALEAGAGAYVLKDASVEDLVCAVRAVLEGRRYLSPALNFPGYDTYMKIYPDDVLVEEIGSFGE